MSPGCDGTTAWSRTPVLGHVRQGWEQPTGGGNWVLRSLLTQTMLSFWDSVALNGREQQEPLSSVLCCHRHLLLN